MADYYLLGKLAFLLLFPVNALFRSRVAIEKLGLEGYRKLPARQLFTEVTWRDSASPSFRRIILVTDYGIIISVSFYLLGLIIKVVK